MKSYKEINKKLIALTAGYPFNNNDRGAIGLEGIELKRLTMNYLYRIGWAQNNLGGMPVDRMTPSFPGGQCPRLEWQMTPDKIQTLVEAYEERAAYASKVMRGAAGQIPITHPPAATPNLVVAVSRQAQLLKEINEASKDISEQGEIKYQRLLDELAALSLETAGAPPAA